LSFDEPGELHMSVDTVMQIVVFILTYFVFHCLVIRPGRVAERHRRNIVASLKGGEPVILSCGIVGRFINSPLPNAYDVEVAPNIILRMTDEGIKGILASDKDLPEALHLSVQLPV
jgi:preprotein translocase YajC subunit